MTDWKQFWWQKWQKKTVGTLNGFINQWKKTNKHVEIKQSRIDLICPVPSALSSAWKHKGHSINICVLSKQAQQGQKPVDRHTLLSVLSKCRLWQGKGFHVCSLTLLWRIREVCSLARGHTASRCRVGKQIFYLFIRSFFFYYSLSTYYVPGSILGSENKMWSKKSIPLWSEWGWCLRNWKHVEWFIKI